MGAKTPGNTLIIVTSVRNGGKQHALWLLDSNFVQLVKRKFIFSYYFVHFDVYNLQNETVTGLMLYYSKATPCTTIRLSPQLQTVVNNKSCGF